MKIKSMAEVKKSLGKDEFMKEEPCELCGGILVEKIGAGISCTFCTNCGNDDYDYDM